MNPALHRRIWPVAIAGAVLVAMCAAPYSMRRPTLEFVMFDVGQGDALMLRCGSHQTIVDGGPSDAVVAAVGRELPPYDRTLERIVVTHAHRDHFVGVAALLERYRVEELLLAEDDRSGDPEYARFLEVAHAHGVPLGRISRGDAFAIGTCARAQALSPGAGAPPRKDPNDASVVLRVTRDGKGLALLTGDASQEVETELLAAGDELRAEVLKVGHHGSRTSTSPEFLRAVAPTVALVSVGKGNRYGHPAFLPLERLRRAGARVWRTDLHGTVRVRFGWEGPPQVLAARTGK